MAGLIKNPAIMDFILCKGDAVFRSLVVVAAIETERYPLLDTFLSNSALVLVPVEAAGAWVAGVSVLCLIHHLRHCIR